jgi:ankyrin repeat protein
LLAVLPGTDINVADSSDGRTPFYLAASNGNLKMQQLLSSLKGIDVNKPNNDGKSPLYIATVKGHTDVVKFLVSLPGISLSMKRAAKDGKLPLERAHKEEIKAILSAAAPPPAPAPTTPEDAGKQLWAAAESGDLETVRELCKRWRDCSEAVNWAQQGEGSTPLHVAASRGFAKIVKSLGSLPYVQINHADEEGQTPLNVAVRRGHADVVTVLLSLPGIDTVKPNLHGTSPFWVAISTSQADIVSKFISLPSFDVNVVRQDGKSLLTLAASACEYELFQVLVSLPGMDINSMWSSSCVHCPAST